MSSRINKEDKIKELLKDNSYKEKLTNSIKINKKSLKFIIKRKPENYVRERVSRGKHFYNPKGNISNEYKKEMISQMKREDRKEINEIIKRGNYLVKIKCKFYIPIQKSCSIEESIKKEIGLILPTTRPDVDNYLKFILDALHDVVYDDDSKVVSVFGEKLYSFETRTEIEIELEETL